LKPYYVKKETSKPDYMEINRDGRTSSPSKTITSISLWTGLFWGVLKPYYVKKEISKTNYTEIDRDFRP
jgi:hypothetical protein